MPVEECPFQALREGSPLRPLLQIRIINPETGQHVKARALIDTGADECAFPASMGERIGHNIEEVEYKEIGAIGGGVRVYPHICKIKLLLVTPTGFCGSWLFPCAFWGIAYRSDKRYKLRIETDPLTEIPQ